MANAVSGRSLAQTSQMDFAAAGAAAEMTRRGKSAQRTLKQAIREIDAHQWNMRRVPTVAQGHAADQLLFGDEPVVKQAGVNLAHLLPGDVEALFDLFVALFRFEVLDDVADADQSFCFGNRELSLHASNRSDILHEVYHKTY